MNYWLRFETTVNVILNRWGLSTISEITRFWPEGRTRDSIRLGKRLKFTPAEMACLSVAELAGLYRSLGHISDAECEFLVSLCANTAEEKGARRIIVNDLNRAAYGDKVRININRVRVEEEPKRGVGVMVVFGLFIFILFIWFVATSMFN